MYIVEWYDQEGDRHEKFFEDKDDAMMEAERLGEEFNFVAVIAEVEV